MDLRYPIGPFVMPTEVDPALRDGWLAALAGFPARVESLVAGRSAADLALTYRPGGWNVRQLVHHCADSHLNGFTRFKLALTEKAPTILPYSQPGWADLPDATEGPVEDSLLLLQGLHRRWVFLLNRLTPEQWARTFFHPQQDRTYTLGQALALYAWHGQHHLAHIQLALGGEVS
jgi:hypothetical protein